MRPRRPCTLSSAFRRDRASLVFGAPDCSRNPPLPYSLAEMESPGTTITPSPSNPSCDLTERPPLSARLRARLTKWVPIRRGPSAGYQPQPAPTSPTPNPSLAGTPPHEFTAVSAKAGIRTQRGGPSA
ncbi:hypothetical protein P7K49_033633 [Saguinus oedipus]|uniref:Uncharacterized protein n=1 Tax=Saguinus oedipus TaxID=9490 RepID=A0ABQ9TSV5_SAGOE|nr:hypothetical protein P7K49_033633 [Saguinus oedipus]